NRPRFVGVGGDGQTGALHRQGVVETQDARTSMTLTRALSLGLLAGVAFVPVAAQESVNADINAKIRQEETARSRIMHTLHMFTDVYGPRVTGSPNLKAAGGGATKELADWGF